MSDFRAHIQADLDLGKAKSQMDAFLNQKKKVKLDVDTGSLNSLKDQLNGLGKNTKIKPQVDTSGVKSIAKEFQTIKSLANQMSKTKVKIAGLDTSKNANELKAYQSQLKGMQSQYKDLMNTFGDSFSKSQKGALENIFKGADAKIEVVNAKAKDLANTMSKAGASFSKYEAIAAGNKTAQFLKDNTKLSKEYRSVLEDIESKQRSATSRSELTDANKEYRAAISSAKLMGQTGKSFGSEFKRAFGQIGQFVGIYGVMQKGVDTAKQIANQVLEVDNAMTQLKMATGVNNTEANDLIKTYSQMGRELKVVGTDVAASATEWMKQGKSIKESSELTKDAVVMSKIGGMSTEDSTKTITAYMKSYDASSKEVMKFVDSISAIDMESATDVQGLSDAFNEVAANAKNAGVESEKVLSYAAVIGETSQEGMSSVGTALNAIFSRMGNIKLSRLKDYENNGEDLSNVETVLRGVGIKLRDSSDKFRDFDDVLDDTAGKWKSFSNVQQRAVASAFSGTHHMNDFMILMENYGKAQEYMTTAQESSGESMVKYGAYQDSLQGKLENLKGSFQAMSTTLLNGDVIKGAVSGFTGLLDVFTKIAGLGNGKGLLGMIGGGVGIGAFMKNLDWGKSSHKLNLLLSESIIMEKAA